LHPRAPLQFASDTLKRSVISFFCASVKAAAENTSVSAIPCLSRKTFLKVSRISGSPEVR
jgi:hypothetical protein